MADKRKPEPDDEDLPPIGMVDGELVTVSEDYFDEFAEDEDSDNDEDR